MDPIAVRIKNLRLAKALTLRRLAEMAGISSASYLLHIENGLRVPNEEYAARLAQALGDDPELYRAWARVRSRGPVSRTDMGTMLAAFDTLRRAAPLPEPAQGNAPLGPSPAATPSASESPAMFHRVAGPPTPAAPRLKIPVLEPRADPGDGLIPESEVIGYLRIPADVYWSDPERARQVLESLRQPFAYPVTAAEAARVPRLIEGYFAVVSRNPNAWQPPDRIKPREAYAVRAGEGVEFISGSALLDSGSIPPALTGLGLGSSRELRERVIGKVELLLPGKL